MQSAKSQRKNQKLKAINQKDVRKSTKKMCENTSNSAESAQK